MDTYSLQTETTLSGFLDAENLVIALHSYAQTNKDVHETLWTNTQ